MMGNRGDDGASPDAGLAHLNQMLAETNAELRELRATLESAERYEKRLLQAVIQDRWKGGSL